MPFLLFSSPEIPQIHPSSYSVLLSEEKRKTPGKTVKIFEKGKTANFHFHITISKDAPVFQRMTKGSM